MINGKRKVRTWESMRREFSGTILGKIIGPKDTFTQQMESCLPADRFIEIKDGHWGDLLFNIYEWMLEPLNVYPGEEKQETDEEAFQKEWQRQKDSMDFDNEEDLVQFFWNAALQWERSKK